MLTHFRSLAPSPAPIQFIPGHFSTPTDAPALKKHLLLSALALVPLNVALPPATAAALRLVCKATKEAVDQSVTELRLTLREGQTIYDTGSELTKGLTGLSLCAEEWKDDSSIHLQVLDVGIIALRNSQTLLTLEMLHGVDHRTPAGAAATSAVAVLLRSNNWPKLHHLSYKGQLIWHIYHFRSAFDAFIRCPAEIGAAWIAERRGRYGAW